jgi:carbon storage regulator
MLVLTRHIDERIIIGDDIVLTVIDVRGTMVRLGIECPKEIRVDRSEVRARIDRGEPPRRRPS